jgi:arginyl-tRNA synthetase
MNIFAEFHERIGRHIDAIAASGRLPAGIDKTRFVVEPPRDASHGDLASNVAMVLAKEGKPHFANPRQLASEIAGLLAEDADVETAEVAGPGFLNIRLKPDVFIRGLREVLALGTDFGRAPADRARGGQGKRRICLRQSERADACRAWPWCRVRRCPRQSAGFCR